MDSFDKSSLIDIDRTSLLISAVRVEFNIIYNVVEFSDIMSVGHRHCKKLNQGQFLICRNI